MRLTLSNMMAATALLAMTACGGGGGGGSTPPVNGGDQGTVTPPAPAEPIVLTLSPSPATVTQDAGKATTFTVSIKAGKAIPANVNAAVAAKADLFVNTSLTTVSAQEYEARITTSAALLPGTYSSTIEVKLCTDAAATCRLPVAGSPWLLPVTLTVKKVGTLSALAPVAGLHAWTQAQYDAARSSYVPASFTPSAFNFRWSVDPDSTVQRRYSPVVIADKTVYMLTSAPSAGSADPQWTLQTIEESTGQERWRGDVGKWNQVSAPVLASGGVSLLVSGAASNGYRTYNVGTGQISALTISNAGTQAAPYGAPLVSDGMFYGQYGAAATLARFDATNSVLQWSYKDTRRNDGGWAISTDDNLVYNYSQGWMLGIEAATGALKYAVASRLPYVSAPATMAPVLSGGQLFVAESDSFGGGLAAFDSATGKLNWQVQANFTAYPALAAGVLYAVNGDKLEARSPANGTPLWSSPALGGAGPYTQVLATNNLVFAVSQSRVVAVDIATRKVVWDYAAGGSIAISDNGILYITHPVNGVVAINMR